MYAMMAAAEGAGREGRFGKADQKLFEQGIGGAEEYIWYNEEGNPD